MVVTTRATRYTIPAKETPPRGVYYSQNQLAILKHQYHITIIIHYS